MKPILIAGPCVLESASAALEAAAAIPADARGAWRWIFKASFLKDNRTSASSYRGPGMHEGLEMLREVKRALGAEILTDIHEPGQAGPVSEVADILQIPAFLCRQTSLLEAAGSCGRIVNVKKGQFMSPAGMAGAVDKLRSGGCPGVWLTERGTFFGYGDLVVDFRSLTEMAPLCDAVVMDVTHSLQRPGARGDSSGGDRRHAVRMAAAAAAWGVDGLFMEVHPRPEESPSDRDTILPPAEAAAALAAAARHWERGWE